VVPFLLLALQQPDAPRAVLARLPRIDFARQCPENRCDHTIEDSVFTVLERIVPRAVARDMSPADVRRVLGGPPRTYGAPETWRRTRDGARIEVWAYARSLSGTQGYFLVFENDRLRDFQRAQRAWIIERYGPASPPR
jgi:hypothetical protein